MHRRTPASMHVSATRRGYLLMEAAISAVLVTAVFVLVARSTAFWIAQQRMADQQRVALVELSNCLEQLSAAGAATAVDGQPYEISAAAQQVLPEARLRIVTQPQGGLVHVIVGIDWLTPAGQRREPVRLATWLSGDATGSHGAAP